METIETITVAKKVPSSHVRFTEIEYKRILKIQQTTGRSIPDLLKTALLDRVDLERPLYDREHADRIITELKRIGNNVNQIAHKINSGLMSGWSQSLAAINRQLEILRTTYSVNHAIR
jgi:hypothetical protein